LVRYSGIVVCNCGHWSVCGGDGVGGVCVVHSGLFRSRCVCVRGCEKV
jgi:hypothetical protein